MALACLIVAAKYEEREDLGGLNIGATLDFTGFDDDDFTTNDALGLSALYNSFNNLSGDISIKLRAFSMISSMSSSSIFGNSGIFPHRWPDPP